MPTLERSVANRLLRYFSIATATVAVATACGSNSTHTDNGGSTTIPKTSGTQNGHPSGGFNTDGPSNSPSSASTPRSALPPGQCPLNSAQVLTATGLHLVSSPAGAQMGGLVCQFGSGMKSEGGLVGVGTFPGVGDSPTVAADRRMLEQADREVEKAGGTADTYVDVPQWGQDAFFHFNSTPTIDNEYNGEIITPTYFVRITIEKDRLHTAPVPFMKSALTALGQDVFG